jgi:hypothetical protein
VASTGLDALDEIGHSPYSDTAGSLVSVSMKLSTDPATFFECKTDGMADDDRGYSELSGTLSFTGFVLEIHQVLESIKLSDILRM